MVFSMVVQKISSRCVYTAGGIRDRTSSVQLDYMLKVKTTQCVY